jgi:tape measure domain-containing protein
MAAQDAELKLKVSLDLGFFRQQLAGLGQAAAGYSIPVQIRFDRRSVQNELNALGANIRRRNYRLNIETNLSAEIAKADTLARKLTELSGKIKASAGGAFSQGPQGAAGLERFMREQGLTGRAFGVQQAQERIARQAVLSRLEKGSLSKGGYNIAGLEKIIRDLGGTPTGGRKDLAAQAKKLVEEADGIADAVFDSLKDLQMKLRPIRGQAQASAARSMPNLNEMLDRMANLTSNPRAAQRMLRALPESRITTDLVGAANRQAAFQQQFPQGFTLPGFNAPKAFDPLLKAIAKDFTDYARTVNISDPWVGQVSNGIANVIAKAAASPQVTRLLPAAGQTSASRMTQQMFAGLPALQAPGIGMENAPLSRAGQYMLNKARRALELPIGPASPYAPNPFAGQATVPSRQYFQSTMRPALPAAGGTSGLLSALEAQLGASRGMLGTGGGIATSLFTGRGLVNPGVSMLEPVGLSGNYRQMAAALANQAANPALAHRQIADIGFGGVPTSATGLSGQALNAALNQAFLQRRGLGISGAQSLPIFGTGGVAVQQNIPGMSYQMGGGGLGGSMGQFPMAGMMGPSTPMSINARTSMFGGGGGMQPPGGGGGFGGFGGAGGFGRAMGGVNLPGTGVIRELGEEFGFATKQVILFGQAYKLLAFIQNLPAQVGAAVGQLQSFRNTLNAVTPSAEEARASNELLLGLMEKYNVPLQSARDGFTKLYASMAPAGFSGDEIRDLFTGITKAAATFGMSADKVDRVNYAFAQMASKGQVMSEELKGQLGDVLPGAMALFAEAAGFKGPKAIQDFSAALEDGAYKGEAMVALLKNVTVVMNKEFGPGAEGAALTFQGVMNRMQNSMTLFYEAFEPVAVGFLNTVVVPMTNGIKQLTDGLNAFFTGTAAKTAGGFAIAQELERLRPAFDGIGQNVATFAVQLGQLAKIALDVSKVFLQIAGNPIVGYLAKLYAIALPINIALGVMRGLWAANALQLLIFNARVASGTSTLSAFRGMMAATGATAQTTAASIRTAGITLRTFFAATGVGLVVVGISMLIEKFLTMNQALADTKAKAMGAAQAIRSMSQTEARLEGQKIARTTKELQTLQKSKETYKLGGEEMVPVKGETAKRLEEAGVGVRRDLLGRTFIPKTNITAEILRQQGLQAEVSTREKQIKFDEQLAQAPAVLGAIPPSEEEGKKKKGKELDEYNRSQLQFIQDQFDIEKQRLDKQLQGQLISQTQYDISLAELELESTKLEIAERYRLEVEKTNKDNLSASDKALKLKDLEINKTNALTIAEDKRNLAIGAARQKIIKPIIDEIDRETLGIQRQALQMEALKDGRLELTSAQEAELAVKERYADLAADERDIAKGELDLLTQIIAQRLENVKLLEKQTALTSAQRGLETIGTGLQAGFTGSAANVFERAMEQYGDQDYATQLANVETSAMQLRSVFEGLQSAISGVSGAFANMLTEGITSMITGTATAKEVFASFLQSVGQALSQAASQMIATYIAIGIAKLFAGLGGGGNPAGSGGGISGSLPGVRQYAGGFGGGGAPGSMPFAPPAFANGGIVTGPTLSLIGEGKYNEAVVPLPDGRSIPVQLGGRSARDMMGGNAPGMPQAPSLSMKFETTKINGVEYVSREQLEQAMAETRRASIAGGAQRGMSMTLDKIKQSPSTRSSIGIR